VTAYGGEAVHAGGEAVGRIERRVRLHGRADARDSLPAISFAPGDRVEVEVFGELVAAEVAPDVLVIRRATG
jgi:hypothetical protein